jgi:hypothetical protein
MKNYKIENMEKKPKIKYSFWIVLVITLVIYIYNNFKITTTGNVNADKQLKEQQPENRPNTGEIEFKK